MMNGMTFEEWKEIADFYYEAWIAGGIDEYNTDREAIREWLQDAEMWRPEDVDLFENITERDFELIVERIAMKAETELNYWEDVETIKKWNYKNNQGLK